VVVAVSDEDTTRIGPLLDTIRSQSHRNLDIRVVPWGSSATVRRTASRHAREDWRIRVARTTRPDLAAARETARAVRARYVLLPAAGDLLPGDAVATLVAVLESSGSDSAVGRVVVPRQGYAVASTARAVAHRSERLGVTLAEAPEAIADLELGSRLFRRTALVRSFTAELPTGADVVLASLQRPFDLVHQVTYLRAGRRDDVVFGARPHELARLPQWWAEQERILQLVAEAGPDAVGWRRWALLDTWLQAFVDDAERASPEQWRLLREIADSLTCEGAPDRRDGDGVADRIGAEARVKLWLLGQDRRTELADLVFARTFEGGDQPTRVAGADIVAELPVPADVPPELLRMSVVETPLVLELRAVRRDAGRTELDLGAWIDHLGFAAPPTLEVEVVGPDGVRLAAEVTQQRDPRLNHPMDRRPCHDIADGAFTVSFPTPATPGRLRLRARLTTLGLARTGELTVDPDAPRVAWHDEATVLGDDERGPFHQRRLQRWAAGCDLPIEPEVFYLQSYTGQHATDSQRALHFELRRRFPHLRLVWGVAAPDVPVPEGGESVVIGSRDWYRTMATARQLCLNIDPDRWFARRPGQLLLQTFHGYPSKAMGLAMWHAKEYGERRIAFELERVNRDWSLILTPTEEMAEHYRRQYRYDGPALSVGYPRDDLLLSPDAPRLREEVRHRLGIAPDQRAVLYAPTWRDDLATDWRSAEAALHLDIERAARLLGPGFVLLLRGHRFHRLRPVRERGARLVDVTAYPEVNELILAADAAVVDYSSIRFDLAFAEVPMVFLVPDLDTYGASLRGFLYPFTDSAPGPLVATTEEVVERLRDIDALRAATAEQVAAFNARYHPWRDDRAAQRVVDALESRWALGSPNLTPVDPPGCL
jgi:CDP-glycerol glycerophosphotransferase (TagB/SpsB family)